MLQSRIEIRVRFAETDAMGVTYHGNYLPWFEMSRVSLLDEIGTPYREFEKQGILLPVLETGLTYHRPSYFDDRVSIIVKLAERPMARIKLNYRVERGNELLVEGFTLHAFVNRAFRPIRPPINFTEAIKRAFSN